MKLNLDDPRTTLRLQPKLKQKAHACAEAMNLSFNQYMEHLIDAAPGPGEKGSIRQQIAELQKLTAQLDQRLHDLQQKKPKKSA